MAKQPAKGRKTPAKPRKAPQSAASISESANTVEPAIDTIPPEVHAKTVPEDVKTEEPTAAPPTEKKESAPVAPSAPKPPPPPAQNAGFFPMALGGLLAGVIGFAIATFTAPAPDDTLSNQIAIQSSAIAALEDQLASAPSVDLSGVEAGQADLAAQFSDLDAALVNLASRVAALEERPLGTGAPSDMSAGVEAEMDTLRAQIAEMTGAAQTELAEARAQAASIEENAAAAARNAAARAALARVQTALESGAPIGAPLGDLEDAIGAGAPEALIAVQDGVPTLSSLQEQFPDIARAALATARSEGVSGEETTGVGAFLRNQFDVRSTSPQEGDSADAILSRTEAAVRTGRLSDALAEISALPEVVRAEMSDWLGQAEARADAMAAVDILSTSLSDN